MSRQVSLAAAATATGTVVVIDVLRAFTTEAAAFAGGAQAITLVEDVDAARRLRADDPDLLLMGEVDGAPIDDFDLGNSPDEVAARDLTGRRLVHRSTAGTRGAVQAIHADALAGASFVTAEATVRWLRAMASGPVTYVITGEHSGRDGDEDRACADYLAARLGGMHPDPAAFLDRVARSDAAERFGTPQRPDLPAADLAFACDLDRYDFALPIARENGALVVRPSRP